ncbi:MAG TPA: energy transducer TonB [Pyrinomonadaceae bacterium]
MRSKRIHSPAWKQLAVAAFLAFLICPAVNAQTSTRPIEIAVVGFGDSETARRVTEQIGESFRANQFRIIDGDRARAAAHGVGYKGSLNLTLEEARNLASAIGCDFFITGAAQTLRRSPSTSPVYFESYASLFLVSARTGKLVFWERQEVRRPTAIEAERTLLNALSAAPARERYQSTIRRIAEEERNLRATAIDRSAPIIELMPDAEATGGVRTPRPFRRPKPVYPDAAAHDQIEATVDVLVDIDANGKVGQIEIARWAGYGLDESVMTTVKQMDFFPAMRDGVAIPMRVLLRYNFRKPPQQ